MALDRNAGGHAFDFDRDVCMKCGMTRQHFEDNDEPPCTGRRDQSGPARHGNQPVDDE